MSRDFKVVALSVALFFTLFVAAISYFVKPSDQDKKCLSKTIMELEQCLHN